MMMERGRTGTEHQLLGQMNSSNEMIPVVRIVGSQERFHAVF
jgi:hypothetical protein